MHEGKGSLTFPGCCCCHCSVSFPVARIQIHHLVWHCPAQLLWLGETLQGFLHCCKDSCGEREEALFHLSHFSPTAPRYTDWCRAVLPSCYGGQRECIAGRTQAPLRSQCPGWVTPHPTLVMLPPTSPSPPHPHPSPVTLVLSGPFFSVQSKAVQPYVLLRRRVSSLGSQATARTKQQQHMVWARVEKELQSFLWTIKP